MKMKKSDINILIMLFGILIPVAVYFFVYNSYTEKTASLNGANEQLQVEVDYLQDLADHKQQYIDDTEAMQIQIAEIKSHFPAQYRPEDDILYIIGVENEQGATIPSISMGTSTMIEVAAPESEVVAAEGEAQPEGEGEEVVEGDTTEVAAPAMCLYTTPINVRMTSSYRSLKDIINKLNTDNDRKSIDSLSVVFDAESGELSSALGFSAYSLTGTENEYVSPNVPGIFYGTSDIFNTGEKSAAILAEKEATEAAEEAED